MDKDLLTLGALSGADFFAILDRAVELKRKRAAGEAHLPLTGRTLAMILEKSSTRTRVSFEAGMAQLGGHALFLSPSDTQIARGEEVRDTARVLSRYVDAIMVRTFSQAVVEELAEYASVPVINGLTDTHHPCQVLADIMTVRERLGGPAGLKLAYIGDGNNMANSLVEGAAKAGMHISLACPEGYRPDEDIIGKSSDYMRAHGAGSVTVTSDPAEAAGGADVLYTDVWASMGQESEREERARAFSGYQIDSGILALARPGAIVLHCLPAHRGEEITDEVIEGPNSAVFDQAENRLHVQKALLEILIKP